MFGVFNMSYKVSVIIPIYNSEKYLDKTIGSVIDQSFGFNNIELLLIDDQSSDNSYSVAEKYAKKYPNIYAEQLSYPAGGASAPRNRGLELATGEYVMFLDSDDYLAKNAVKDLLNIFENYEVDIADGTFEVIVGHSNKGVHCRYDNQRVGIYDFAEDIDEWFPIAHPIFTKMFRMNIIRDNGLQFDETIVNGEDSLFLFQYMARSRRAYHCNTVVHEYRRRDESLSHNYTPEYFRRFLHAYSVMEKKLTDSLEKQYFHKFLEFTLFPNMDILCDSLRIDDDEKDTILRETIPHIRYMIENGIDCETTPIGRILSKDIARDDPDDFLSDFHSVEMIYKQRADMMNDVFSSRGWKLITAMNRLIGR